MQSSSQLDLKSQLQEIIPGQQDRLKKHGNGPMGSITVDMVLGLLWEVHLRGITGLLWETSLLDAEEGIRFRGMSIHECQEVLPAAYMRYCNDQVQSEFQKAYEMGVVDKSKYKLDQHL